jgi:cell division protein FtsN
MARRGEDGFHFSFGQLALLAGGVSASVVFAFFLGIYVGREAAFQHAPLNERVARVPSPDLTTPPRGPVRADAPAGARPAPAVPVSPSAVSLPKKEIDPPTGAVVPFTVQVVSTRNRAEAEQVRSRLLGKRIGAFVSEVEDGDARWYRVRIGRYDDMASATAMADRLKNELGFAAAQVVPASTHSDSRR